ncbi:ADP-ribosylglycohydrolase [Erwinia toletana]|uniref:ADP-ribosylglycohydrolase n=1 Tax=Winslowiella toletana TaxID=92490 RepID=A0ABS4P7W3_9GAMM|nr:ADP-ribosylglycohydrolase family protein [Winslowiella toletana]MBP2168734.1 ADP-ribosylglycohydrolase [Winslowiella toletana]
MIDYQPWLTGDAPVPEWLAPTQPVADIDTLEAAMWSVWHTDNFRDAILLAANLADDADSVAATAGQIAGALYGYAGIPQEWRDKLVDEKRIADMAEELYKRAPQI